MRIVLAGAFGKLGSDILRALCATDHQIVAADAVVRVPDDVDASRFETRQIDVTRPETLEGLCDGADVVVTTVGLTGASTRFTNYDIDYQGNLNLIEAARRGRGALRLRQRHQRRQGRGHSHGSQQVPAGGGA